MRKIAWIGLATAVSVFAQGPGGRSGHMGFGGPGGPQHTVTGAPYTGVEVTTRQQILAGGNVIQSQQQSTIYRDSQGRVRTESTVQHTQAGAGQTPTTVVTVHDPVAGVMRRIDAQNRVVHESAIRPGGPGRGPNPNGAAPGTRTFSGRGPNGQRPADPNVTTETLGLQTVNGVPANGTRITRTIPAGAMGNAQAIQSVREVWTSVDLKVPVMVKTSDPRFGTTVTQLTNINRSEPDAALFQAPAGYTVQRAPAGRPTGRGPRGIQ
jgi:hypothetical protein